MSTHIFGGAKDFCPNFPPNFLGHRLCIAWSQILNDLQKQRLHVISGAMFSNQSTLGAIFACIFRGFAQIFRDFARVFTDFAQIFLEFAQIFRDFARIFTKWEHLGVRLHSLHPRLLHHCLSLSEYRCFRFRKKSMKVIVALHVWNPFLVFHTL